jgi:hypothetical protein
MKQKKRLAAQLTSQRYRGEAAHTPNLNTSSTVGGRGKRFAGKDLAGRLAASFQNITHHDPVSGGHVSHASK